MKHLKLFESLHPKRSRVGKTLWESKNLDEEIKNICMPFIDNGYNVEVLHNYGSSIYTIWPPCEDAMGVVGYNYPRNILKRTDKEKYFSSCEEYTKHLAFMASELSELHDRLFDIYGFQHLEFHIEEMKISFHFKHKVQGKKYKCDSVMLGGIGTSQYMENEDGEDDEAEPGGGY